MIRLTIPGRPVPCVRMTQKSKWVSPAALRSLAYKDGGAWIGRKSISQSLSGSVGVTVKFYLYGLRLPDIDNLIKAVFDGLNGVAWADDRQVVRVTAERLAATSRDDERAEIEIVEVQYGTDKTQPNTKTRL